MAACEAALLLSGTPLLLTVLGVQRCADAGDSRSNAARPHSLAAARIGAVVDGVAAVLPWRVTCLHRALVTRWMLHRRGVPSDLTIGVRRDRDGFAAHAWVGYDGITRDRALDHYTTLNVFRRRGPPQGR